MGEHWGGDVCCEQSTLMEGVTQRAFYTRLGPTYFRPHQDRFEFQSHKNNHRVSLRYYLVRTYRP